MKKFVADTHAAIWFLGGNKRLSRKAHTIFANALDNRNQIIVPSVAPVEAIFLAQRGQIEGKIAKAMLTLPENPNDSIYIYPLNMAVVEALSRFGPATVPDLPDRIIAATALHLGLPLLTVDSAIKASGLVKTVW